MADQSSSQNIPPAVNTSQESNEGKSHQGSSKGRARKTRRSKGKRRKDTTAHKGEEEPNQQKQEADEGEEEPTQQEQEEPDEPSEPPARWRCCMEYHADETEDSVFWYTGRPYINAWENEFCQGKQVPIFNEGEVVACEKLRCYRCVYYAITQKLLLPHHDEYVSIEEMTKRVFQGDFEWFKEKKIDSTRATEYAKEYRRLSRQK